LTTASSHFRKIDHNMPRSAQQKNSDEVPWNDDHPAKKLLYKEIKDGAITKEMGPAEVYCNYSDAIEFKMQGMEFGSKFTRRLRDLRKQIEKEGQPKTKTIEWKDHPARDLLVEEFRAGRIPLDPKEMGPAEIYYNYADTLEFKMDGMEHGDTFTGRLLRLRNLIKKDKKRALKDHRALATALQNHPVPLLDDHGRPQWNGSVAQSQLKRDIAEGMHKTFTPLELYNHEHRNMYRTALSAKEFRWKIQQEVRTAKYLHTLKYKSNNQRKSKLEKEGVLLDSSDEASIAEDAAE